MRGGSDTLKVQHGAAGMHVHCALPRVNMAMRVRLQRPPRRPCSLERPACVSGPTQLRWYIWRVGHLHAVLVAQPIIPYYAACWSMAPQRQSLTVQQVEYTV